MMIAPRLLPLLCLMFPFTATAAAPDPVALAVGKELDRLARTDDFSGVVLIAKNGKPVLERAYGFANRADRVPNRTSTRFNMASMGKMVTAVAIMQLVEAGKISLTGTVGSYLPAYPNAAVRDQVNVAQLLSHTSGMGNFWEQINDKAKQRYSAVADYLPLFADAPLTSVPGERFAYSNNGYIVLGLIIEAVSGQSYADYVRTHVYGPAGMRDSDAFTLDAVVPRMATGYARSPDRPAELVSNIFVNSYRGGPAGGSYATASDLLKFSNALLSQRLLKPAATALVSEGKVDYGARRYAYGFTDDRINGHRLIGHGGGHTGIANELMIFTDLAYTAIILTNGDVENFWAAQNAVKLAIAGKTAHTDSFAFTRKLIALVRTKGLQAAAAYLSAAPHPPVRAGLLEQFGDKALWEGDIPAAVDLFTLYTSTNPDDAYAWLGLGRAQERAGATAAAITAYARYLRSEPEDREVKATLQKLEKTAAPPPR